MRFKESVQVLLVTATVFFYGGSARAQEQPAASSGDSSVEVYSLDGPAPAIENRTVNEAPPPSARPMPKNLAFLNSDETPGKLSQPDDSSVEVYNPHTPPSPVSTGKTADQQAVPTPAAPPHMPLLNDYRPSATPSQDATTGSGSLSQTTALLAAPAEAPQSAPPVGDYKPAEPKTAPTVKDSSADDKKSWFSRHLPHRIKDAGDSKPAVQAVAHEAMPVHDSAPVEPPPAATVKDSSVDVKKMLDQPVSPPPPPVVAAPLPGDYRSREKPRAPDPAAAEMAAQAAREEAADEKGGQCADAGAMQRSLIKKIALLENEKERLRARLEGLDPGKIEPVYQCAAETNKIADLEAQVKYLTDEYETLKKQNLELSAPKPEEKASKAKGASAEMPDMNLNPGMNLSDPKVINEAASKSHEHVSAQSIESGAADRKTGRDRAERLDIDPANERARAVTGK